MTRYKVSTKVIGKKNYYFVAVEGHAGYEDKGKDIVCSGVSSLVFSLVKNLMAFGEKIYKLKIEDGIFRLKVEITDNSEKLVKTFLECLEDLELQYRDFIAQDEELK
jgi:uncharacterized protein YsxB (DUF464 family)